MTKKLFFLIMLYSLATNAQQITFNRTYPNLTYSGSVEKDVVQAPDGGYVISNNQTVPFGNSSYAPFATDSLGSVVWEKLYSNDFSNSSFSIDATPDGGYILAGDASGYRTNNYQYDAAIMRINSQGDSLWWKFYGEYTLIDSLAYKCQEYFLDAKVTKNGNIIAVGRAFKEQTCSYMVLTDPNGDTLWTWKSNYSSIFRSVTETPEGDFIAVGNSQYNILTGALFTANIGLIVKISKQGQLMWVKEWGDTKTVFNTVASHPDGFVVGGYKLSGIDCDTCERPHAVLFKFDKNGNELWKKIYSRGFGDQCGGVTIANNNNIVFVQNTGTIVLNTIGYDFNLILIKYDTDGNKIWERFIGSPDTLEGTSIIITTTDGGFLLQGSIIVGQLQPPWLLKLDSLGMGPYSSWIGIEDVKTPTACLKVYPNPANEQLFVELSETQQNQQLEIFTITGEKVAEFTLQPFTQNSIDTANLANGLYLFRLKNSYSSVKVIVNH